MKQHHEEETNITPRSITAAVTAIGVTPVSTTAPPATAFAVGGLTGTWPGNYRGTFTLTWQQSGSNVNGSLFGNSMSGTCQLRGASGHGSWNASQTS